MNREIVIVAHSMGALVAFHTLLRRPVTEWPRIRALITIGSPLGSPGMPEWFADATTADNISSPPGHNASDSIRARWEAGALDGAVGQWINVLGQDDQIAYSVRSTPKLAAIADTTYDLMIQTQEGDEHGVVGYLKNQWVASAIAQMWCPSGVARHIVCQLSSMTDTTVRPPRKADNVRLAWAFQFSYGGLRESQPSDTSSVGGLGPTLYVLSPFFPGTFEYRVRQLGKLRNNHSMVEKPWLLGRFEILGGVQYVWGKVYSYENENWTRSAVRGWAISTTDITGESITILQAAYLRQRDNSHRSFLLASFALGLAPDFLRK